MHTTVSNCLYYCRILYIYIIFWYVPVHTDGKYFLIYRIPSQMILSLLYPLLR